MDGLNREELLELKEFLTERMVDNMSTKELVEYVANDLFNYYDKLGEHEFMEEAREYWCDEEQLQEIISDIRSYTKCEFKQPLKTFTAETD